MELTNEFRVGIPVDAAWNVLTDVERIAPCMPGAQLQEIEGDEYRGIVKVKVGPITAQYKGAATFTSKDDNAHVAVLKAEGRETRGQGNANAIITATLVADGDGTKVTVLTDLTVTGKVAQFGRGVMADVSAKLLTQFVECLESSVLAAPQEPVEGQPAAWPSDIAATPADQPAPTDAPVLPDPPPAPAEESKMAIAPPEVAAAAPATAAAAPQVRRIDSPEPQPVNLLDTAGAPVAKRVGPIVALVAVAWLLRVLLRRRRRNRA
jgi:carbon monoxide dehydrogenase subunit G